MSRMNQRGVMLLLFVLICLMTGFIGKIFTDFGVHDWYPTLEKPFWTPPNWLFGPVWTALYLMMAISLWLVWDVQNQKNTHQSTPYLIFGLQLFCNFLWSYLFFTLKNPLLGLIDLSLLVFLVVINIKVFSHFSKKAALLLIPYLIWIGYAWSLNFAIWRMN